jgi:hypothetical protein
MATSYRKFSQEIIDAHYGDKALPEAGITQRFIAEWVAMLVAKAAVKSAFVSSNALECTYANDQFISVFYNCPLLTDAVTGDRYSVMPATPAGLPKMREIAQISFVGSPGLFVVPEDNKDEFIESQLPPLPSNIILFKVEGGNIVFPRLPKIINSAVNMKLIGAVPPGTTILDSVLNVPKDVEQDIRAEILNGLALNYKVLPQTIETGEPS